MTPFFQKNIEKLEYKTLLEQHDATHLVTEVIIGSSIDIIVEYEHSRREDRNELESALSKALEIVSNKLNESAVRFPHKTNNIQTENLRISVKGPLKKNNFLGDVSLVICRQNIFSKIIVAITIISI